MSLFEITMGFSSILPKVLDAIQHIKKERIFLISLSITILSPKILRFLFSRKKKPNLIILAYRKCMYI